MQKPYLKFIFHKNYAQMKLVKPLLIGLAMFVILTASYEYYIYNWSKNQIGALIRVDIIIVYPIILMICGIVFWISKRLLKKH